MSFDSQEKHLGGYPPAPAGGYPPAAGNPAAGYPPPGQPNNYYGYPAQPQPPAPYFNPNPYPAQQPQYGHEHYSASYNPELQAKLAKICAIATGIIGCILFTTLVIFLLVVLPPDCPEVRIDTATVSNFKIDGTEQLTADWVVGFNFHNPNNKAEIHYDRMDSSVYHKLTPLAYTKPVPFDHAPQTNNETIRASYSIHQSYFSESVLGQISAERKTGTVGFNVRITAWISFENGQLQSAPHETRIFCDDVKIAFPSETDTNGTLVGRPQCKVLWFKWSPIRPH